MSFWTAFACAFASRVERTMKTRLTSDTRITAAVIIQGSARLLNGLLARFSFVATKSLSSPSEECDADFAAEGYTPHLRACNRSKKGRDPHSYTPVGGRRCIK